MYKTVYHNNTIIENSSVSSPSVCPLSLKEGSDSSICRYMCIFLAGSLYCPDSLKLVDSKYIFSLCKDYMWTSPCTVLVFFSSKHIFFFLYKWYYLHHTLFCLFYKNFYWNNSLYIEKKFLFEFALCLWWWNCRSLPFIFLLLLLSLNFSFMY